LFANRIDAIFKNSYFYRRINMALPNKPVGELKAVRDPEVVEKEVDILIVGGGMAACGTGI
jgi:hypothetical protein